MSISHILSLPVLLFATLASSLTAQTADSPIFEQHGAAVKRNHQEIIDRALVVREEVSALSKAEIDEQMQNPQPQAIELPPALRKEMSSEEIATHARKFNLRVGYCYQCTNCDDWHINLAGGYAIAEDVIVTCDHVLATKVKMRDGFLVAFDHEGNVACAVAVLARSEVMDAAIIKVAGARFTPVPLNSEVRQGSASYCFSYPLKQEGYFSAGVINRFFWDETYEGQHEDKNSIDAISYLRVNYSNDWAPGSSGSPLFDSAGNVTGHVSTISAMGSGRGKPAFIILHKGIPARCVQSLAAAMGDPDEVRRLALITEKGSKEPGKQEASKTE